MQLKRSRVIENISLGEDYVERDEATKPTCKGVAK